MTSSEICPPAWNLCARRNASGLRARSTMNSDRTDRHETRTVVAQRPDAGGRSDTTKKAAVRLLLVDTAIQSVQRIATELRPVVLDQLGLIPAIEWQTHEFQTRTGIQCTLDIYLRSVALSHAGSNTMFRVFSGNSTNVARHSWLNGRRHHAAGNRPATLCWRCGITVGVTESELSDPHSLGLVGMRTGPAPGRGNHPSGHPQRRNHGNGQDSPSRHSRHDATGDVLDRIDPTERNAL